MTVGLTAGVALGVTLAGEATLPVCLEDQVHTTNGTCVTPGDPGVDYIGGFGWVVTPPTEEEVVVTALNSFYGVPVEEREDACRHGGDALLATFGPSGLASDEARATALGVYMEECELR